MGKSINKFIVRLSDQTAFRPQLAVSVVPNKEQKKTFEVRLINPNTKEVAFREEFKAKGKDEMACFVEALNHGKIMLERPEVRIFQYSLEYKEQLFIPQGRRGKMKLKTKDSDEAVAERQAAKEREAELAANGSVDDLPEFVEEDVEIPEELLIEENENHSVLSTQLEELEEMLAKKAPKKKKEPKTKNKVEAKENKVSKKETKVSAKKAKVVAKPAKNKKKVVKKAAPKKKNKNKRNKK